MRPSQSGVVVALDRLDYEVRCASSAKLVSGGTGVTFTFPSQCPHTYGNRHVVCDRWLARQLQRLGVLRQPARRF